MQGWGEGTANTPDCDIIVQGLGEGIIRTDWFIACYSGGAAGHTSCLETTEDAVLSIEGETELRQMALTLKDFGEMATRLTRNPLGIIALFQVLIYGIAGYVTANLDASGSNAVLVILTWFLVLFPVLVLGVFTYLVVYHHNKLYAPSDFSNEENFMRALEAGLNRSPRITEIETTTKQIRNVIDGYPLFIFAQLPRELQAFLQHLHLSGQINLKEYPDTMPVENLPEFHGMLDHLNQEHEWLEINGDIVRLSEKGSQALKTFIELTIPRFI